MRVLSPKPDERRSAVHAAHLNVRQSHSQEGPILRPANRGGGSKGGDVPRRAAVSGPRRQPERRSAGGGTLPFGGELAGVVVGLLLWRRRAAWRRRRPPRLLLVGRQAVRCGCGSADVHRYHRAAGQQQEFEAGGAAWWRAALALLPALRRRFADAATEGGRASGWRRAVLHARAAGCRPEARLRQAVRVALADRRRSDGAFRGHVACGSCAGQAAAVSAQVWHLHGG